MDDQHLHRDKNTADKANKVILIDWTEGWNLSFQSDWLQNLKLKAFALSFLPLHTFDMLLYGASKLHPHSCGTQNYVGFWWQFILIRTCRHSACYLTPHDIQVLLLRTAGKGRMGQWSLGSCILSSLLWSRLQCDLRHINLPFLRFVLVYRVMIAAFMIGHPLGKRLSSIAGVSVPDSFCACFLPRQEIEYL